MPGLPNLWTDIDSGGWIARLPAFLRPYALLMRLDRPIGVWLLVIPCWWGMALASPGLRGLWFALLFAAGAIVMRGAGCVINDIIDRELDAQVERTRLRPLANGDIKMWQATIFLALLLALGFFILLRFNEYTIVTGGAALPLIFIYPLTKRVTWWPQLFLGLAFNWGAFLGWSAVADNLGLAPLFLYIGGVFWTLAYDTVYAHQDKRDDALVGIKSTALRFGEASRGWVGLFYLLALGFFALAGWRAGIGHGFYALLVAAAGFVAVELVNWRMDDPESCLIFFRKNREFGLIVLLGILLGQFM